MNIKKVKKTIQLKTDFIMFVIEKIEEGVKKVTPSGVNIINNNSTKYKQIISGLQEQLSIQNVKDLLLQVKGLSKQVKDLKVENQILKNKITQLHRDIDNERRSFNPVFEEIFPEQAERLQYYKQIMELPPGKAGRAGKVLDKNNIYPSGIKSGKLRNTKKKGGLKNTHLI